MSEASRPRSTSTLRAGEASMPALGLGTWELRGRTARRVVDGALELGYRHLDTAQAYGNEAELGRSLESSGVPRDEIFIVTKVWPDRYAPERFSASVQESLRRLRVERVDLLLLHWPVFEQASLESTVESLAEARTEGRARHVGVSNFTLDLVDRALGASRVPLVVDQAEYHPFLDQERLLAGLRERGLALTAYSPLAKGRVLQDPTLRRIGERHGATAAQVALGWLLRQGVAAIPRTSDLRHLAENLGSLNLELSDEEVRQIDELARPDGRILDPDWAPSWD